MKRILSLLLSFALCLGCLSGGVGAAEAAAQPESRLSAAARALPETDEPVRVVVLLEGEPAAKSAEQTRSAAAKRVARQHAALRQALTDAGLACRVDYEYGSLLNGMALTLARRDLEKLAALPGVRQVCVANRYAPPAAAQTASVGAQSGPAGLRESGFTGSGTVVAVLDSGVTPAHEAFGVYAGMLNAPKLDEAQAQAGIDSLGYGVWLSKKIPFAYDYADRDDDVSDDAAGEAAGHGTQAAGIAAGYARTEDGEVRFCGAAPEAQLLAMKIFSSCGEGGTDAAIVFKALEDAYLLGADVVNLSLGAPSGFAFDRVLEDEIFGNIYETLRAQGVPVVCGAGNDGSMAAGASTCAGFGFVSADYADYGLLASPASYGRNLAVASAESESILTRVLSAGEREIRFRDVEGSFFERFRAAGTMEYVVIPDFGRPEDYLGLSVRGRIALVCRGEISDQEKLAFADQAGAVALLVYNNEPGAFSLDISNYLIPAAAISREDGEYLVSLAVAAENQPVPTPDPDDSSEDLPEAFYAVTGAEDLIPGSYLIVSETAGLAFDPSVENVNAPGNWQYAWGFQRGIPAEGQILAAALEYEEGALRCLMKGVLNSAGNGEDIVLMPDSGEDLQISIQSNGSAEIRCRGSSFRYSEAEERFRFFRPGSPALSDPRSAVVLYRRSRVLADPSRVGELGFPNRFVPEENEHGGEICGFSSMGVTPELGLKPTLTGLGGSVCSAAGGSTDGYVLCSDSALAAADVSGALACLLQHLAQARPELGAEARASLAEALLESSARLLFDDEGRRLYSPRRQGAGLIDLEAAAEARACVTEPVLSLGDSEDGVFTLRFRVQSLCEQTLSYNLRLTALRDELIEAAFAERSGLYNSLCALDVSEDVELLGPSLVVLPAGETVEVELTLRVRDELLERMRAELPNGGFLDGFLALQEATKACDGGEDCPGRNFTDMPRPGSWSHPGIDFVLRNGYFSGTSDTTFTPRGTMDRAMTVTVLYSIAGRPAPAGESPFYDVPPGKYYTKAVTWAAENGIVAGGSDGSFDPRGDVTREQLATILLRFAEYMGLDTETRAPIDGYPDVDRVHAWARSAMSWAVGVGVLSGSAVDGEVFLQPRANATRDQVAVIFMSFVKKCLNPPAPGGEAHVSFTAFVGDWSKAPILEPHDWREIADSESGWSDPNPELLMALDVNTSVNRAWLVNGADVDAGLLYGNYLGSNPRGVSLYDAARSCLSHSSGLDTVLMQPMLLRNARHLIMTVTDAESGALYAAEDVEYLGKALWDPAEARWRPSVEFRWDGSGPDGEPLPDGTRVEIRFYANLAWGEDQLGTIACEKLAEEAGDFLVWHFGLCVDDSAPVFEDLRYDPAEKTLSVSVSDGRYLAYTALCGTPEPWEEPDCPDGMIRWSRLWADEAPGAEHSVTVDSVEPGEYTLIASDYAGNETRIRLALGSSAELCPVRFVCPADCGSGAFDACYASPGAVLSLPALEGTPREGEFCGWITEALEGSWSWSELTDAALTEELRLPGEKLEIWGETWLYALLRSPAVYSDPGQLLVRSLEPAEDYSGMLAFGAYDRDAELGLRLMDCEGGAWESETEDVLRCEEPDPAVLFRVEACPGGYTVCSADGLYMVPDGDYPAFVQMPELEARYVWQIEYDEMLDVMRVYSSYDPACPTLIYDVLTEEFRLIEPERVHFELRWLALYRPAVLEWGYFTAE